MLFSQNYVWRCERLFISDKTHLELKIKLQAESWTVSPSRTYWITFQSRFMFFSVRGRPSFIYHRQHLLFSASFFFVALRTAQRFHSQKKWEQKTFERPYQSKPQRDGDVDQVSSKLCFSLSILMTIQNCSTGAERVSLPYQLWVLRTPNTLYFFAVFTGSGSCPS